MRELASRHRYYIGLDLGQKRDHSAYDERDPVTYAFFTQMRLSVKFVERVPLGTGLRENKTVEKHDDLAFSLALAAWGLRVGSGGSVMR